MEHFSLKDYKPFHSMAETLTKCSNIRCRQYLPSEFLQPYISCYWTMTSETELVESVLHRVIPDGCIDIIFSLNGNSNRDAASIVGTMTKPIFAELKGQVNYLAIRFLPGGFLHFFDGTAYDFTDRIIPLQMMSKKEGCNLTEQLVMETHIHNKIQLLESYLENLLCANNTNDPVVQYAIYNILKNKGSIKISELTTILRSSQRQLLRKFDRWIGVSPKVFCRIIRFQSILRMFPHRSRCNLLSIALDGGYYDQSHFIHEFNSYYGLNPSDFLKTKNI